MCLKCGVVNCGRNENGHAIQHYTNELNNNHYICINTINLSVFWFVFYFFLLIFSVNFCTCEVFHWALLMTMNIEIFEFRIAGQVNFLPVSWKIEVFRPLSYSVIDRSNSLITDHKIIKVAKVQFKSQSNFNTIPGNQKPNLTVILKFFGDQK